LLSKETTIFDKELSRARHHNTSAVNTGTERRQRQRERAKRRRVRVS
jgi:hypothetical protein